MPHLAQGPASGGQVFPVGHGGLGRGQAVRYLVGPMGPDQTLAQDPKALMPRKAQCPMVPMLFPKGLVVQVPGL